MADFLIQSEDTHFKWFDHYLPIYIHKSKQKIAPSLKIIPSQQNKALAS